MSKIKLALAALLLSTSANAEFVLDGMHNLPQEEFDCLVLNSYFEARNQSSNGQMAVTNVVLNRMKDNRYPNTACEVIKQAKYHSNGAIVRHKCQFSWFCDGKSDDPKNIKQYQRMLNFSLTMLSNSYILVDITDGALFYHADYVKPSWAKTKHRTTEIGDHIFYTWDK